MQQYDTFLASKRITTQASGFEATNINSALFPFQQDIVRWAVQRGRAALFADCGMGKTAMQLEWAHQVVRHTNGRVLILAPLAVAPQTKHEGEKFHIPVTVVETQADVDGAGIYVTNYEKLHHFEAPAFDGIVLDESSILKAYDGKTRTAIIDTFRHTPYKLACTATPSPNDYMELGNHAEFLNVMSRTEMLATFFVHDGGDTSKWRLKGHAESKFWEWVCSWAVMLRKPSDLGYSDDAFCLPPLSIIQHTVASEAPEGQMFAMEAQSLIERRSARKASLVDRVQMCADLVNADKQPWIVWCDLNAEGDMLEKAIPDAVQIAGSDSQQRKEQVVDDFLNGRIRVLVSKPSIFGWGLNFQHCAREAFVGLSDSYEQFYQAVRRCWRFGQQRPVEAHVITSEAEGAVVANIERKEADAQRMALEMVKHMQVHTMNALHKSHMVDYQAGKAMRLPAFLLQN